MADKCSSVSIEDLPSHLILEILSCGQLGAIDLVSLELTSRTFGGSHGLHPHKFRSLVDLAAFQLCGSHPLYVPLSLKSKKEIFDRCDGKWKRILRFLQCVKQSSDTVETSAGNVLFLCCMKFIFSIPLFFFLHILCLFSESLIIDLLYLHATDRISILQLRKMNNILFPLTVVACILLRFFDFWCFT